MGNAIALTKQNHPVNSGVIAYTLPVADIIEWLHYSTSMDCINRIKHLKKARKKVLINELILVDILPLTDFELPKKILRLKR